MGWTQDQEKAIYTDTGSGNLLVSAAAGSGKTAVLVERVLEKILSGKSTIDRLLIVTFTEAAASEMRQKIVKRLFEYLESEDSADAQKKLIKSQIHLVQTADIMTIDGFCNRVVLNNFHTLGIDPNIQICDDAMAQMLISEAMDNLFCGIYKSSDEEDKSRFRRLTDFYAKDRSNDGVANLILGIYRFTEAFADPIAWLEESVEDLCRPALEQNAIRFCFSYSKAMASSAMKRLKEVQTDNAELDEFRCAICSLAERIAEAESWDAIYNIYVEYFNAPKKRNALIDKAVAFDSSQERDAILFETRILCSIFTPPSGSKIAMGVSRSKEDIENSAASVKEEAEDIAWIVKRFMAELEAVKEKRNLYEFSDIEHFTYRLFAENETVRNEYRDKYDEILIDEYQDTNMLQDTIFELISHNNIFMVGDLKQSIYRFRKGDPYIFKGKAQNYVLPENEHNRIMLSQNFRSRQEVLGSVNDVFRKVMSEVAGDVEYTDSELIVRNNEFEYYPPSKANMKSELHYIAIDNDADIDRDVCEARYTALEIKELLSSGREVYDKNLRAMRPIQKRDIVILENSVKYNAEILTTELSNLGIESYVDRTTFFDRREISTMLSLISVINNSHDDIPLMSVLRSPIGGFTDEELAKIRIQSKNCKYFIDAMVKYGENCCDKALGARCFNFVGNIRRWRDYVRKKSVAQLIWAIYEETCFYDMMGALEEGEEAQTNLRLLYERAKQFESAGFKGLFNFIKYIDRLKDGNNDLEGAKLIGESHDVVRIMTIHKSKGLEFPYVFLLGAGRDFPNKQDSSVIKMHKELGFGLQEINYEKHYSQKTHAFELINRMNKTEGVSERMRLLYVALTRPREKLYVVMAKKHKSDSDKDEIFNSWKNLLIGNKMLPGDALLAKGFYGWICPAALASPDTWDIHFSKIETTIETEYESKTAEGETYEDSVELRDSVYKILDYKYPHSESFSIPTRTSVTQLKERAKTADNTEYEPDSRRTSGVDDVAELMFSPLHSKPKFMQEIGERPANEIGTLYHLVMSKLDLDILREEGADAVDSELDRLRADGALSDSEMEYINSDKIRAFFDTDLARRMLASENINRERPFQINISAREYDPGLSDMSKDDTVVLQGIIDCFFEEEDGFVLFDYKTDKVKSNSAEIRLRYEKQLELYKKAIEKLTSKPVKESYLYLFDTGETV